MLQISLNDRFLPLWLCLWLPLAFLFFQLGGEIFLSRATLATMHTENGFHELMQFGIIGVAFFIALFGLFKMMLIGRYLEAVWLALGAMGSLYVAGEEVSWGQHFFGWDAGEYWTEVNDQGETNLHNTSSWLDQKPRLILEILIMTAGIFIPLLKSVKKVSLPKLYNNIYPPLSLVPVACIVVFLKLSEKSLEALNVVFYTRASEVIELYIYYYIMLYLIYVIRNTASAR